MNFYESSFVGQEYIVLSILFFVTAFIIGIYLIKKQIKEKNIKKIIYIGFILRLILVIQDNFFKFNFFSGYDGANFNYQGYRYLMGYSYIPFEFVELIVGPIYSLFRMQVPSLISSINLLASLGTTILIYKIIKENTCFSEKKEIKKVMLIYCFSFFSMYLSVAFLRESMLIFFATIYIYNYFKFEETENYLYLIWGFFFLGLSSYLHSGMIFLGVLPVYKFYFKTKGIYKVLLLLLLIPILFVSLNMISKVGYFRGQTLESLVESNKSYINSREMGTSTYITPVTSSFQLVLTMPLRYIYFLFSPTPNFWRGVSDVFAFLVNSTIYLYLSYFSFKNYKKIRKKISEKDRILIESLIAGFILVSFVYAMGTLTAGTAIRHRDKILPLLIIIYILIKDRKNKQELRNKKRKN